MRVFKKLFLAMIVIIMTLVITFCSNSTTGPDDSSTTKPYRYTQYVVQDEYLVTVFDYYGHSISQKPFEKIWNIYETKKHIKYFSKKSFPWSFEGNKPIRHPYFDFLGNKYTENYFLDNHLVIVWGGYSGEGISQEIVDIDDNGNITMHTIIHDCPCCNHDCMFRPWAYIIELPKTYRPNGYQIIYTCFL